jgi:hypothetical protein
MMWHRRETRRQTEKTKLNLTSGETCLLLRPAPPLPLYKLSNRSSDLFITSLADLTALKT